MSDFSSSSGTVPSADQAATPQHPAVPMSSLPLSPPLGSSRASVRQSVFPAEPSSVQQPPVVTQPSLVEQYPVVSQLHAYTSFAPPVFSRPRPTATTQDQFRYGMPQMPDSTISPLAPPLRASTFFPASVLVPLPLPPQDPLQANMVDTQSDLVDHLVCLMEVVHRQIYWQMRQTESLFDTHHHLQFLWENAIMSDSVQPFEYMSPLWSPVQDLPEEQESDFINRNHHQEATNPYPVPRGDASSSFHPYLTPNHDVPFKKHRRIRCSKCHQKGHPARLCPQRQQTGCYTCGDPSHRMVDCREYMSNPVSLPPQRQAYLQSRRNSSSAASSSGHPPPAIRTTPSSEPKTTAPNPPPQTNVCRD